MSKVKFNIGEKKQRPTVVPLKPKSAVLSTISPPVVQPSLRKALHLADLSGQDVLRRRLNIKVKAYLNANRGIGHWLFTGPSGLGKTTLVRAFAYDLGVPIHEVLGNRITSWDQIVSVLKTMKANEIFFIDEIHALKPMFQNNLYDVMEEFKYNEVTAGGVQSRQLPVINVFGATTHVGYLNAAMQNRFRNHGVLVPYTNAQLAEIIDRTGIVNGFTIPHDVVNAMAGLVQGTPRVAITLVENLIDVASAYNCNIDNGVLVDTLKLMGCDPYLGLDYTARKYMFLLDKHGSMGKEAISDHINEEEETVKSLERYLFSVVKVQELGIDGALIVKSRGRKITEDGKKYIQAIRKLRQQGWFLEEVWS